MPASAYRITDLRDLDAAFTIRETVFVEGQGVPAELENDEHDRREEEPLVVLDEKTALVDARFHTDDLAQQWDLSLPNLEFDTVGGFMLEKLGRELRIGDRLEVAGAHLTVHSMRGRSPRKIMIVKHETPESQP